MKSNKKLNRKLVILTGIRRGIIEIKEYRRQGKSLQTLSDFLSENNS